MAASSSLAGRRGRTGPAPEPDLVRPWLELLRRPDASLDTLRTFLQRHRPRLEPSEWPGALHLLAAQAIGQRHLEAARFLVLEAGVRQDEAEVEAEPGVMATRSLLGAALAVASEPLASLLATHVEGVGAERARAHLRRAVELDFGEVVRQLIWRIGAPWNAPMPDGGSGGGDGGGGAHKPICHAAMRDSGAALKALFEAYAERGLGDLVLERPCSDQLSLLVHAIEAGDHVEALWVLVEKLRAPFHGPMVIRHLGPGGGLVDELDAHHLAAYLGREGMLDTLTCEGGLENYGFMLLDANAPTPALRLTPLHLACMGPHLSPENEAEQLLPVVRRLVRWGHAAPTPVDAQGRTPLDIAEARGFKVTHAWLKAQVELSVRPADAPPTWRSAELPSSLPLLQELVAETERRLPGFWATIDGRLVLRKWANDAAGQGGGDDDVRLSQLRFLIEGCGVPVHAPLTEEEEACLAPPHCVALLREKPEAWGVDGVETTPLDSALFLPAYEARALYLLSRPGVTADALNAPHPGRAPLLKKALCWPRFSMRVVAALLERGADPLAPQVFDMICSKGSVALFRLSLPIIEQRTGGRAARALLEELEDEPGWHEEMRRPRFFRALHSVEALRFFRDEVGIDLRRPYPIEWADDAAFPLPRPRCLTPLMGAAACGFSSEVKWLAREAGARDEAEAGRGWTAMHAACGIEREEHREEYLEETVKFLVEQAGADPTRADKWGRTPLQVARDAGFDVLAGYLEEKEAEWRLVEGWGLEEEATAQGQGQGGCGGGGGGGGGGRKKKKKKGKKKKRGGGGGGEAAAGGSEPPEPEPAAATAALEALDLEDEEKEEAAVTAAAEGAGGGAQRAEEEEDEDEDEWLLGIAPDEFVCPVTHVLLRDPCVAADGFTYQRSALDTWIATCRQKGNPLLSPKTLEPMGEWYTPNLTFRTHVLEWIEEKTKERAAKGKGKKKM